MLRLGLTGGIATGKSTVASILRELGFAVLDADSLSHTLMEPGLPAYNEIQQAFGASILDPGARINRSRLAAIVFAEPARLAQLNSILHPRVEAAIHHQFAEWARNGQRDPVFVEAALLVEANYHKNLDGLVVTWCRPEQQLQRLRDRGLGDDDARRRIAAQLPLVEKLRYATEKIDCSGTLQDTRKQVAALAARLRQQAGNA